MMGQNVRKATKFYINKEEKAVCVIRQLFLSREKISRYLNTLRTDGKNL